MKTKMACKDLREASGRRNSSSGSIFKRGYTIVRGIIIVSSNTGGAHQLTPASFAIVTPASFASFSFTYSLRFSGEFFTLANEGTVTTLAHCLAKKKSRSAVLAVFVLEASREVEEEPVLLW
jgi:hypothetical protein